MTGNGTKTILSLIFLAGTASANDGWTVLEPVKDSRVVYVSSSAGADANSGLSPESPKKALTAGQSLVRNGHPDWLLLKCGDVWESESLFWKTSGDSESRKQVISSYDEGPRPVIKNGKWRCWEKKRPLQHFAIIGIDFYASFNDPASPDYQLGESADNAVEVLSPGASDILLEGNRFRNYPTNVQIRGALDTLITNVDIRRNTFTDSRGFGLLLTWVDGGLLEENTFDRSGWETRTKFLHNAYVKENLHFTARGNIFSRGGNFGLKISSDHKEAFAHFVVEDNLFYLDALSIGHSKRATGYNPDIDFGTRYGVVSQNVFMSPAKTLPHDSTDVQAVAMITENMADITFDANVFIHNTEQSGGGIVLGHSPKEKSANITFTNSLMSDWKSNWFKNSGTYIKKTESIDGFSQDNNFETGVQYTDPMRDLVSYSKFIGGTEDSEAFLSRAAVQSRANWDPRFTAAAFNDYIRNGFCIKKDRPE